ncbi:MAG: hypothetical protein M3179_14165 [Actinomycetota bacterium]|nr:hypothetical protein [Actinomycetota bacterium]
MGALRRVIAALGTVPLAVIGLDGVAEASHGSGHWRGAGVRIVTVEGRGIDTSEAATVWSATDRLELVATVGSGGCETVPGRIVVCIGDPWGYGQPAAIPQLDLGRHISSCVAAIPPQFLSSSEFAGVVNHEVGHCLGLGHRELESRSVMGYADNRYPDAHDLDEIRNHHGHDDGPPLCLLFLCLL